MKKAYTITSAVALIFALQFLVCSTGSFAQDVRHTQSYTAPLRLNPALMGLNTEIKGILSYRTQWSGIADGYTTSRFTMLYPLIPQRNKNKMDIGFSAIRDKAGAFTTLDIAFALSYSLQISESNHLTGALSGAFIQKSLEMGSLTFDEQYVMGSFDDANTVSEELSNDKIMYPDFGFGLLYFSDYEDSKVNFYAGLSAFHHNKPNETFKDLQDELPLRYTFHAGVKIKSKGKFEFTPNIQVFRQGGASETALGLYTDYVLNENMKLTSGLWYRYNRQNTMAIMLGFEHEKFGLAYSFDMAPFALNDAVSGALTHEITLNFKLQRKEKKGTPKID